MALGAVVLMTAGCTGASSDPSPTRAPKAASAEPAQLRTPVKVGRTDRVNKAPRTAQLITTALSAALAGGFPDHGSSSVKASYGTPEAPVYNLAALGVPTPASADLRKRADTALQAALSTAGGPATLGTSQSFYTDDHTSALRCAQMTLILQDGSKDLPIAACSWADAGSVGTVIDFIAVSLTDNGSLDLTSTAAWTKAAHQGTRSTSSN